MGRQDEETSRLQHAYWTTGRLERAVAEARHPDKVRSMAERAPTPERAQTILQDLALSLEMVPRLRAEFLDGKRGYIPYADHDGEDYQILSAWLGIDPAGWNDTHLAERLGLNRSTLWRVRVRFCLFVSAQLAFEVGDSGCTIGEKGGDGKVPLADRRCWAGSGCPHCSTRAAFDRSGRLRVDPEQIRQGLSGGPLRDDPTRFPNTRFPGQPGAPTRQPLSKPKSQPKRQAQARAS